MIATVEIPDKYAPSVFGDSSSPARAVLEAVAADAHRRGKLTKLQIREWLGHESVWETRAFVAEHCAGAEPSLEEILMDANTASSFILPQE